MAKNLNVSLQLQTILQMLVVSWWLAIGKLHHSKYFEMVTTSSSLRPEKLPLNETPTPSLPVEITWLDSVRSKIVGMDENGRMIPIKTDAEPAPEWLLKVVGCRCNMSLKTQKHYDRAEKTESNAWMIVVAVEVNYVQTPKQTILFIMI